MARTSGNSAGLSGRPSTETRSNRAGHSSTGAVGEVLAEQLLRRRVRPLEPPVRIDDDHAVRHLVEHGAEADGLPRGAAPLRLQRREQLGRAQRGRRRRAQRLRERDQRRREADAAPSRPPTTRRRPCGRR
jgi:hypothetical protein